MPQTSVVSGTLFNIVIWCVTTLLTVATVCFVSKRLPLLKNTTKINVNQVVMDYDLPNMMPVQAKAFMELITLRRYIPDVKMYNCFHDLFNCNY